MKNLYRRLFIFSISLFSTALFTQAQITQIQQSVGGNKAEHGYSIDRTIDGNYVISGYTESAGAGKKDAFVVKVNQMGETIWNKAIGAAGDETAWKVKATQDSGYIVVGTTNSFNSANADAFVMKLDKSGKTLWTNRLATDSIQDAYDVIESRFGGFYVTGVNQNDSMNEDMFLARITNGGTLLWWKNYGTDGLEEGYSLGQDNIGNIYVVGMTSSDSVTAGARKSSWGDKDIVVLKTDSGGDKQWMNAYGTTSEDIGWGIDVANDNDILVTGWTKGVSKPENDVLLISLDSTGKQNYSHAFGTPFEERAFDVKMMTDGSVSLLGYLSNAGTRDLFIMNANDKGQILSSTVVGDGTSTNGHWPSGFVETFDKGVMIASTSNGFSNDGSNDLWLVKTDNNQRIDCNETPALINNFNVTFSSIRFGHQTNSAGYNSTSFSNNDITGAVDSTHCCKLTAEIANDTVTICGSDVASLGKRTVTGITYKWTTGGNTVSTSGNPTVKPSSTTTYQVLVTSNNNLCAADSAEIVVQVNTKRTGDFARDTAFCVSDSVTFTSLNNMNLYSWSGDHISSNNQSIKITKADTIYFFGIDKNSCTYRDTMVASTYDLPEFSLGPDTTICSNATLTLNGPASMTNYSWTGGSTGSSLDVSQDGSYNLAVVDQNGCKFNDDISVFTNPFSPFTLGVDTGFCENTSFIIRGPGALTDFVWNDTASTMLNITVDQPGTYWLSASNSFGCPYSDTIVLTHYTLPTFSLGADKGICENGATSTTLEGPAAQEKYLWSTGSPLTSLTVNAVGTYWLQVTGSNDCVYRDSIDVFLRTSPIVDLGPDTSIDCENRKTIVLDAGSGFSNYDWNTGATTQTLTVGTKGTYSVTITDGDGCTAFDDVVVDSTCTVSISQIAISGLKVYPNPAQDFLEVTADISFIDAQIEVYNLMGELMNISAVNQNQSLVQLSLIDLPKGVYFVRISTNGKVSTLKINKA